MKSRHNKLFIVCAVIAFGSPLLMALKDGLLSVEHNFQITFSEWTLMAQDITLTTILTVLSGFIVTFFCQKEYAERTIIGQLTSPISRTEFLLGKAAVWGAWHLILTVLLFLSTCLGAALLYPGSMTRGVLLALGLAFLAHGFWIFLALLPLLAVAVLQRETFYTSLILCLVFMLISTCSNSLPGLAPFLLPWSAARILGTMPLTGTYLMISVASLLSCGALGLALGLICFRRQRI